MSAREDIAASAPVWVADRHEDDWTATVGSEPGVMTECCTDGVTILSKMNPGKLQMPIGTRVICIKTQHLNNLHIAMQHSTWITADKVGEKINRVYEDHSPEAGEKVLFIFSINRQRAFCALAEMNGPWVQGESRLSGWQEVAGSFNIVGSIPVTFTHVKNVANDHFEHVHHENPNQPITNMWNGMHFQLETGREVVKLFHKKPHFTNVLCRDKRKAYNPFDPVMCTQDVDPTVPKKYGAPSSRFGGRPRTMQVSRTLTNWRHNIETTPTRAQNRKRIEGKPATGDHNTSTPTKAQAVKRDHAPSPLRLRTPTAPPQATPSPRTGQIIKCVVDEHGTYVPIGSFEDPARISHTVQRINSRISPLNNRSGPHSAKDDDSLPRPQCYHKQQEASIGDSDNSLPSLAGMSAFAEQALFDDKNSLPSAPGLHISAVRGNLGALKIAEPGEISSSDRFRAAVMNADQFVQYDFVPSGGTSGFVANCAKQSATDNVQAQARLKNEQLLSYQSIRCQLQRAEGDSASSSEYADRASTSEIERLRIAPISPTTDGDPFVSSVSKKGSPTTKTFETSINRVLRGLRNGQRATPTLTKFGAVVTASYAPEGETSPNDLAANVNYPDAVGRGGDVDGGVPIFISSTPPPADMDSKQDKVPSIGHSTGDKGRSRGLSSLSGVGQLPSSILPAMMSAGQYAPGEEERDPTTTRKANDGLDSTATKQPRPKTSTHADNNGLISDGRSDLLRFSP